MTSELIWLFAKVIGAGITIAFIILGMMRYGERREELKVARENQRANEKAKETEDAIKKLADDKLRDASNKWVRD